MIDGLEKKEKTEFELILKGTNIRRKVQRREKGDFEGAGQSQNFANVE